ncbi:MAG: TauD/TfdA family dioxygenase [Pseudomonadota bacterium]
MQGSARMDQIPEIVCDASERCLRLHWGDGHSSAFHFVWLRHQARCSHGMPNDVQVKIDLLPETIERLAVKSLQIEDDLLVIDWQDQPLTTHHHLETLRRSAYDDESRRQRKQHPVLWNRDTAADIPVFEYPDLKQEAVQLELLLAVRDYGIAKIKSVPTVVDTVADVSAIFGPMHFNNYGGIFSVQSNAKMNLGSNTGDYLPPHTDESYRHDAPGISLFHCIEAAPEGGESILVDGFEAARILREVDNESFEVLSRVPVFFQRYALPEEDMRSHTRMLVQDIDGDVVGVRWTDRTLPPQDIPSDLVEPVYRAFSRFRKIINSDELIHCYRLNPGDLHVFDNHRVLHGRLAFDASQGARHLQQCSVNRDEFHNRLRRLAAELEHPAADLVMAGGAVG